MHQHGSKSDLLDASTTVRSALLPSPPRSPKLVLPANNNHHAAVSSTFFTKGDVSSTTTTTTTTITAQAHNAMQLPDTPTTTTATSSSSNNNNNNNKPLPRCYCLFGIGIPLRYFSLCALTLQTTCAVVLTRYSKVAIPADEPKYANTSLVVSTEVVKLLASLSLMFWIDAKDAVLQTEALSAVEDQKKGDVTLRQQFAVWKQHIWDCVQHPKETCKLAIPAFLYTLQNNMIYVALANLEATTFQVGYQSKVITTAVLSVLMLGTKLSMQRWVALFLLMTGIILTQLPSKPAAAAAKSSQVTDGSDSSSASSWLLGVGAVLCSAFCSAFAGVYFEKILKGTNPSVWLRNAQLAFFSTLIGLVMYAFDSDTPTTTTTSGGTSSTSSPSFFQGYNTIVFGLIAIQALGGLIIAVVVKYADNILKGFATALSIVLCGFLSAFLMGFQPTGTFLGGCFLAMIATVMYSY